MEDKPCFDGGTEHIGKCMEGTLDGKTECTHLAKGGTWEDCSSGGKSEYLGYYRKFELDSSLDFTLRDFLAGCALAGPAKEPSAYHGSDKIILAREAYAHADAMLKAREE